MLVFSLDHRYKSLVKVLKILQELEEKELPLMLDNYNNLREETNEKYHCPK